MGKALDLVGMRFGRLTVMERVENDKKGKTRWRCQCECGEKTVVIGGSLRKGNTKSCGCLHREVVRKQMKNTTVAAPGKKMERLYAIWTGMKQRCYNPNKDNFRRYGGRGITVCDEWRNDYAAFRSWALTHGYAEGLSIDRINVDGNYCPENCRWADAKTQSNNRRSNRTITCNGETKTLTEWAADTGIPVSTIHNRLKQGWCVERALETPVKES